MATILEMFPPSRSAARGGTVAGSLDTRIASHASLAEKIPADVRGTLTKAELADRLDEADRLLTKADQADDQSLAWGYRERAEQVLTEKSDASAAEEIRRLEDRVTRITDPGLIAGYQARIRQLRAGVPA